MHFVNQKSTLACPTLQFATANPKLPSLNDPVDISDDFRDFSDTYFLAGTWIDYQTRKSYTGGWHRIVAGEIPELILLRDGTLIEHIALAQSTLQMDWSKLELTVYAKDSTTAKGMVYLPGDNELHELTLTNQNGTFELASDPSGGKVTWDIRAAENK